MRRTPTAALMFALPVAGGCISPGNDRLSLGTDATLPALRDPPPRRVIADDPPSLHALDRSGWRETRIDVPVDGTDHMMVYTTAWRSPYPTPRGTGAYPTLETALVVRGDEERLGEVDGGLRAIAWGAWDAVLLVPRIIARPPWKDSASPAQPYERLGAGSTRSARFGVEATAR